MQRRATNLINNKTIQGMEIANLQAAANVAQTKAITEAYRLDHKTERDNQKKREDTNSSIALDDAKTRNKIRIMNAKSAAEDAKHNRDKDSKRVSAEVEQKNAQTERYKAQTNKQYGSSYSNNSGSGIPLSNSTVSRIQSMISAGKTEQEIADQLGISLWSVVKYRKGR